MSFDTASNINIISRRVVKEILNKPINNLEKENREYIQQESGCENLGEGYVDLTWCLEQHPRRVFGPTRFVVSGMYDPPFDAILGYRDTRGYGLIQGRDYG
jgi:hypothetical protein